MTSMLSAREKGAFARYAAKIFIEKRCILRKFFKKILFFACNRGVRFVNVLGDETKRLFLLLY